MSYLKQLQTYKASLEINVRQCDNDIEHAKKSIELLENQKRETLKQIDQINEAIAEEEIKQP